MSFRRRLLIAAAPAALLASPAVAQVDITEDVTGPINSSTIDDGAPGDIDINAGASVTVDTGVAVTVDSSNTLVNNGSVTIEDANDSIGVRGLGGADRSITNSGAISVTENTEIVDPDSDGDADGLYAEGSGRIGILIEGDDPFGGSVINDSFAQVTVRGNDSASIRSTTAIEGDVTNEGTITMVGNNSVALDLGGDVGGDVRSAGAIRATGENTQAVLIQGDVAGGFENAGAVSSTGFRLTNVSNYFDPDQETQSLRGAALDADDLLDNGAAIAIGGDLGEGFLNQGGTGEATLDDVENEDGTRSDDVQDTFGDYDNNRSLGSITSTGSAPAVYISPDVAPNGTGDLVISTVVEEVQDVLDADDDDNTTEIAATFLGHPGQRYNDTYGFINRGTITSSGLNTGFSSNAITIIGSADGSRGVLIETGMLNLGSISATAFEEDATTMVLGDGVSTGRLDNGGLITARALTETDHEATAILIEPGATITTIRNDGVIRAEVRGDQGSVFAIVDRSGTVTEIENTDRIIAEYLDDLDDDNGDGLGDDEFDGNERTGRVIAIDLSANQTGVLLNQFQRASLLDTNGDDVIDELDADEPEIVGDILFGSGNDQLLVADGSITGDITFGGGQDILTISGDASVIGDLFDSSGVDIALSGSSALAVTNEGSVSLSSLRVEDQAELAFGVDLSEGGSGTTQLVVTDVAVVGTDATLAPIFTGVGARQVEAVILSAADLQTDGDVSDNLADDSPFLYNASIAVSDTDPNAIVATLSLKTPEEAGMSANQAAAFDSVVASLGSANDVGTAIANIRDEDEFFFAYDQLLPDYSGGAARLALAQADGSFGAVANRLDIVRGGRESIGAAWLQEFVTYMDRSGTESSPGFRGHGFGLAFGLDRPLGPFYAVGMNFVGSFSQFEEHNGLDTPLASISGQLGAYAAANLGPLLFDVYGGAGIDEFDSERNIQFSTIDRTSSASWSGYHYNGSARLALDFQRGRIFMRPRISADYLFLDEDNYEESGGGAGIDLGIFDRQTEVFAGTAGITIGGMYGSDDGTWWSPRIRLGYRNEFEGTASPVNAYFLGSSEVFVLRPEDLPESGGVYGFSFAAGSRYSSFSFDYDIDSREDFIQHIARVGFRFLF